MSTPPRPSSALHEYRTTLDRGCRHYRLGGIRVWRSIKAVSQLLVIAFSFWGAVTGALDPSVAFVGMIAAYLGAEGVETVLLAAGESTTNLSVEDADDRDREAEPDGGAVVAETPKRDPRHED